MEKTRKEDFEKFKVGDKVEFIEDFDTAFPHFFVNKGLTGKIVINDEECISIKMDKKLDGAENWNNEVHLYTTHEFLYPSNYIRTL